MLDMNLMESNVLLLNTARREIILKSKYMNGLLVGTFQARNAEIFVILPQRAGWTHFAHQY